MSNSKALEIHLKVREPEHPVVALSFNNLGNVYYKQGKLEEALQYYRQTLGIMRKAFGDLHPHVAVTNRCISLVLKESAMRARPAPCSPKQLPSIAPCWGPNTTSPYRWSSFAAE